MPHFRFLNLIFTCLLLLVCSSSDAQIISSRPVIGGYPADIYIFRDGVEFSKYICNKYGYQFNHAEYDPPSPPWHPAVTAICQWPPGPNGNIVTVPMYNQRTGYAIFCPGGGSSAEWGPLNCNNGVLTDKKPCPCEKGNPVNLFNSEKIARERDYSPISGPEFVRYYSNFAHLSGAREGITPGWRHTYSKAVISNRRAATVWTPPPYYIWANYAYLPYLGNQTVNDQVYFAYFTRPEGYSVFFSSSNGTTWTNDKDENYRVTTTLDSQGNVTQWVLLTPDDEKEFYDAAGRLTEIRFKSGRNQILTYSDASTSPTVAPKPDLLIQVKDNFGRALSFRYDVNGKLSNVTDPVGGIYVYSYDSFGNLEFVKYPNDRSRKYHYNENPLVPAGNNGIAKDLKYLLTGISDEVQAGTFTRYANYGYDTDGKATFSEHAGGAEKYYFSGGGGGYVNQFGTWIGYNYTLKNGRRLPYIVDSPPLPGFGYQRTDFTYDDNSNLTMLVNFRGGRTAYAYDLSRNLEISRTEALWTTASRRVATIWHTDFRLPIKISEPKKTTSYTYDSAGNLIGKSIQATTDENGEATFSATPVGAPQAWAYTYDSAGNLLTVKGPRTDVNDLTTYTYDVQGNLTSETNALGHTISYSNYDAAGRVGRIVDPNGLATEIFYNLRGWVLSKKVGNEQTSFEYDGVGKVTKVTLPDLSYFNFTYDAARRLTGVSDGLGNQISYTLDSEGNRISEQIKDAGGTLTRQITRAFNALNLAQQVTGSVQ